MVSFKPDDDFNPLSAEHFSEKSVFRLRKILTLKVDFWQLTDPKYKV